MKNITALTVFYKTTHLVDISLKALRVFYPDIKLIVVNNSPEDDECTTALVEFAKEDKKTLIVQLDKNYGHGPGLNRGMEYVETPFVYIFDSDSEIIKEGMLENMVNVIDSHTYGTGFTRITSLGGSHRDGGSLDDPDVMTYLHPLACVISMHQYNKFPKFTSGGAPFNRACSAIKDTGNAEMLIKFFPVIKGARGAGAANYIRHHNGQTRARYGICSPHVGE